MTLILSVYIDLNPAPVNRYQVKYKFGLFNSKGLSLFRLNINSFLHKIEEFCSIAKNF